ncbi:hypothetical protein CHLNCDRAFT_143473 [Chlorella variabilis]|uniref:Mechanosensitive ion channel MscS domain-containing protein n=1 Tax=Chlorella variabilis TaxID=554065 RepID=E1ZAZ8_CHLVA|nr:hypothetical protein CHLNCDRAFT_143473 [Chlorella variabilis]EFN57141.1 hypothetical protein CHLNCDRAFT_143473 [Chlorella variabilis]|eukprot:XP_005849243.1 hypothetical protein CHLNCDRAFT_143473 [Chlorella variabilis]
MAAAAAESWIKATGVPLLEAMKQMTLQQAAVHSGGLIAATVVGVVAGLRLLELVGEQLEAVNARVGRSNGLDVLVGTALASVHRPALVLLPWYGFFYILLVASAFAKVAVTRLDATLHAVTHMCAHQLAGWLSGAAQLMQDTSQLVLIIFLAWFLIGWKAHLLRCVLPKLQSDMGEDADLARLLVPLSNLLSWAIVACAGVTTFAAFGIDVRPLLTVGSIGTVAVGFAAQSTMQNVVSALQIYSSRPFIVGDRIQLRSLGGSVIVAGKLAAPGPAPAGTAVRCTVEHIAPMRTVINGGDQLPVYINNKDVMNLIVVNESKRRRGSVPPGQVVTATLAIRYQDVELLPRIEQAITEYLCSHADLDHSLGAPRCVLSEFNTTGPQLTIRAVLQPQAASRQPFVTAELLREAEQIVRAHGAYLAIEEQLGQALPPSPPTTAIPASQMRPAGGGSRL